MATQKPSNWPSKIAWNTIPPEQQELYANLYGKIDKLERQAAERRSGVGQDRDTESMLNIASSLENFDQDIINQVEESLENMARAGAFFAREAGFARGLQQASREMSLLLGSSQKAAAAFEFLSTNMQGFGKLRDEFTRSGKALTGALALQQAAFERAGISATTFKDNVDMMVYTFGLNAQEVQSFSFQIRDLAKDLDMMPEQVSRNFQLVAKNLSYDMGTVTEQFARMQKLSAQTGVDVGTISGQFGSGMDTISGASGAAANINALLGRNAFSATELLMMDEATRAESVREAIMNDPRLKASLAKGGPEAKFALDTIKDILGMSRDDARRFITTGKLEDADKPPKEDPKERSVKEAISAQLEVDVAQESINNFSKTVENLDKEFEKLVEDIQFAQLSQVERESLAVRRDRITTPDPESLGIRLRGLERNRDIPGQVGVTGYTAGEQLLLTQVPSYSRALVELEASSTARQLDEGQRERLMNILRRARDKTPREQDMAADEVMRALREQVSLDPTASSEGRAGLEAVSLSEMEAAGFDDPRSTRQLRAGLRSKDDPNAQARLQQQKALQKQIRELQEKADKETDPAQKEKFLEEAGDKLEELRALNTGRAVGQPAMSSADMQKVSEEMTRMRLQRAKARGQAPQGASSQNPIMPGPPSTDSVDPFTIDIKKKGQGKSVSDSELKRLRSLETTAQGRNVQVSVRNDEGETTRVYNTTVTLENGTVFAKLVQHLEDGILTMKEFKTLLE